MTEKWWETTPCDCEDDHVGYNPARPGMDEGVEPGWVRCWDCGGLWDRDGNDVLAELPEVRLTPEEIEYGRKERFE